MKRLLIIMVVMALSGFGLAAQVPKGYELVDSLVYSPAADEDETLSGSSILTVMPKNVKVVESNGIRSAMSARKVRNQSRNFNGYRIRIFFDNSQDARGASSAAEGRFRAMYPGISTYRTFESPYFKVTVGDFRTKSEAQAALLSIKSAFPSAFIVRERFKYPALGGLSSYKVDTVKVLHKKVD